MDSTQFGAFVAQLRKEQNMTQRELAQRLNVTDKAVSKWETGKGFPDVKLLEPLAQALGVSVVELFQGRRQPEQTLTMEQAETVVAQAMDQSQKATALRYLRLFRWFLTGAAVVSFVLLLPYWGQLIYQIFFLLVLNRELGVIGSADGTTYIVTSGTAPSWLTIGLPAIFFAVCVLLALRVRSVERKLR